MRIRPRMEVLTELILQACSLRDPIRQIARLAHRLRLHSCHRLSLNLSRILQHLTQIHS